MDLKYSSIIHSDEQTLLMSGMNESMNFIYTQFKLRYTSCFVKRFKAYLGIFTSDNPIEILDNLLSVDYFYGGSSYFNSPVFQDSFFSQSPEDLKQSVQLVQQLSDLMANKLTLDFMKSDEQFFKTSVMLRPLLPIADIAINFNSNLFVHIHNVRHLSSVTEITIEHRNQETAIPREPISTEEFIAQHGNMFSALSAMAAEYIKD